MLFELDGDDLDRQIKAAVADATGRFQRMKRDMVLLINKGECTNVFADHLRLAQRAFPDARTVVWQGEPPSLKGKVVVKIGNTFFLGSAQFEALENGLKAAHQIYIVHNDYTSPPPTQVRRALRAHPNVVTLSTVPDLMKRIEGCGKMWDWCKRVEYVDWNRASWPHNAILTTSTGLQKGLIYWGALRPDRQSSFDRYFKDPYYRVSLSGAHRSRSKWQAMYPNAEWQGRLTLDACAWWQATLYIEDNCQHQEYHSVASRFYEAVGRGLLMLVDIEAEDTFEDAGININPWLVTDQADVKAALKDWERLRNLQQKRLVRDYAADAVDQLRKAVRKWI